MGEGALGKIRKGSGEAACPLLLVALQSAQAEPSKNRLCSLTTL